MTYEEASVVAGELKATLEQGYAGTQMPQWFSDKLYDLLRYVEPESELLPAEED